jgi:hypothetical protein
MPALDWDQERPPSALRYMPPPERPAKIVSGLTGSRAKVSAGNEGNLVPLGVQVCPPSVVLKTPAVGIEA